MTLELRASVSTQTVSIESVQKIVAETTSKVTQEMVQALIVAHQTKMNFKELAEKHINVQLADQLSKSDAKSQMVYKKLFDATLEHIQRNSQPLKTTFEQIIKQTGDAEGDKKFLGSFVFPAVAPMINKLQTEQPEVLERPEIWQ